MRIKNDYEWIDDPRWFQDAAQKQADMVRTWDLAAQVKELRQLLLNTAAILDRKENLLKYFFDINPGAFKREKAVMDSWGPKKLDRVRRKPW